MKQFGGRRILVSSVGALAVLLTLASGMAQADAITAPHREREIIVLKRYLELDTDEICAEMGLPTEGAVRALLSRAQARLSGLLSRQQGA